MHTINSQGSLTDDRRQVIAELEHESFDIPLFRVAGKAEGGRIQKTKERIDRPVVQESEAANLIAHVREAPAFRLQEAEHAHLRIGIAEMWNLENLRLALEGRERASPEEALSRIQRMTCITGQRPIHGLREIEIPPRRSRSNELIVEGAHGIRGQHEGECKIGELLHIGLRQGHLST